MQLSSRASLSSLLAICFITASLTIARQSAGQTSGGKSQGSGSSAQAAKPAPSVPPYFKSAKEAKPLPAVLPASRFKGKPAVVCAYEIANKIPEVLAQEPCYCMCHLEFGHRSLLDCYTSDHTAGCATCVKEAYLVYTMHKQGKNPAQIREAIIRGDWKKMDLDHPPVLTP